MFQSRLRMAPKPRLPPLLDRVIASVKPSEPLYSIKSDDEPKVTYSLCQGTKVDSLNIAFSHYNIKYSVEGGEEVVPWKYR